MRVQRGQLRVVYECDDGILVVFADEAVQWSADQL